jgi:hypothetical protein
MRGSKALTWFSHCFLILLPSIVLGQTPVGGVVYGKWESSGNPYLVESTLIVPPGQTLLIEHGVEIYFQGPDSLKVYGTLRVTGLESDSVYFFETGSESWLGIWLLNGSVDCEIKYASIQKPYWGIRVEFSRDPTIKHSKIIATSIGIKAFYSDTVRVEGCDIIVDTYGAHGVFLRHSEAVVEKSRIFVYSTGTHNSPSGIKVSDANPIITDTEIVVMGEGTATGIDLEWADKAYLSHNLVWVRSYNYATGIAITNCYMPKIYHQTISIVSEDDDDKCIGCFAGSSPLIENCILFGDGTSRGVVADNQQTYPLITYTCAYWHSPGEVYVNCTPREGCFIENPLFQDHEGGDFHLTADSPCIDAGNPTNPWDPDNTPPDLGYIYYYQPEPPYSPPTTRGTQPLESGLLSSYPNPFNSSTRIMFNLEQSHNGQLAIYNQQGRLVDLLRNGIIPAGENQIIWDALNQTSGVYWIVLQTDHTRHAMPVIYIK